MADLFEYNGGVLPLGRKSLLMGIVNVTPDSFSDGGEHACAEEAVAHAARLVEDGADMLDIGGESTRPSATAVDAEEEWRRIGQVVRALHQRFPSVPLSVDTYKAEVAARAVEAGAAILNDITGFSREFDEKCALLRRTRIGAIIMHSEPISGQYPTRESYIAALCTWFRDRIQAIRKAANCAATRLMIDPGVGFNKTQQENLWILQSLDAFKALGQPLLLGISRKSILGALTGILEPHDREFATAAATACTVGAADVHRVHNVAAMRGVLQVADAIVRGRDATESLPQP